MWAEIPNPFLKMIYWLSRGYELWVMNYELWVMNYELWIMNYELWIMSYELWVMNYELWVMSYELWVMSYELWVMSYESSFRTCFGISLDHGSLLSKGCWDPETILKFIQDRTAWRLSFYNFVTQILFISHPWFSVKRFSYCILHSAFCVQRSAFSVLTFYFLLFTFSSNHYRKTTQHYRSSVCCWVA